MSMNVPFVDLKAQYQSIKPEIGQAIQLVINDTAFVKGKYVKTFEEEYANEEMNEKHVIHTINMKSLKYLFFISTPFPRIKKPSHPK